MPDTDPTPIFDAVAVDLTLASMYRAAEVQLVEETEQFLAFVGGWDLTEGWD